MWQGNSDRNDSFPNMSLFLNPVSFLVVCIAGWLNEHQQRAIEYLTEENRVLREQIGDRRQGLQRFMILFFIELSSRRGWASPLMLA
jgi:hypothetical protein